MAMIPPVTVPAPEPRGLRYGLLTAANGPLPLSDRARGGGVQYEPVSCGFARMLPIDCEPDSELQVDDADGWVLGEPFMVYATYPCRAVGTTPAKLERRVRRRLANGEQTQAEAGLASVLTPDAEALPAISGGIAAVVGELEEWLYADSGGGGYGNVGYLHASPKVAAVAADAGLIVRDAPLLRTPLGTIWTFGAGYPPGVVYVSGQVTVWRAETVDVPPPEQLLDRSTNKYVVLAQREYAVAYDCVAAVASLEDE